MASSRAARRAAAKPGSYVDLTIDDSDEEPAVIPLQTSQRQNKRKRSETPSDEGSEVDIDIPDLEDEEYEIDYIVNSRWRTYRGKAVLEYFIHWKNYGREDRSWTLASQLEDDDPPVLAFYKRYPNKPRASQRTVLSLMNSQNQSKVKPQTKQTAVSTQRKKRKGILPAGKENQNTVDSPIVPGSDGDFVMDTVESSLESTFGDSQESSEEEIDEAPMKLPKKVNGGWGVRVKAPKKPTVDLGRYSTGVLPLDVKTDSRSAQNISDGLPPLSDIESIFFHLTSRLPSIAKLVTRLNGRKLRVATMCSLLTICGTESPLLALNMIAKAVETQHGLTLAFDHVFSCEIEPFKQAYIERNFAPPILFRDVTELGRRKAHTAYGSLVDVPGNIDILIAGTSCVDYSGLNNEKQDIDANGESGRTFRGMLQWVNKHRPPIVILENVCNAPWDKVVEYFGQIDYDANYSRLDTKEYYIPHTRTRVYLFATPINKGGQRHLPKKWAATVKELRRPWSSPFEAFLLPTDDANIHRSRLDLAAAKLQKDGTQRKPTDWGRCESRHARAREEEELGILRPLTAWKEAGVCKGLDWTWNDWLLAQTERVLDLLEISTLRMAKDGVDSGFKACIWNVSQNVDRQTGASRTALAPCLTPNMIPWVTNRGGPVTGREALALQGIPVKELLLTSENEDQLADLAGNAMTTTVVGASMLAAFHVALLAVAEGEDVAAETAKERETAKAAENAAACHIVGDAYLQPHALDLAKVSSTSLDKIMDLADRSSRHCECEGQSGTASAPIDECTLCGYRACQTCGGRPEHSYRSCQRPRMEPSEFEQQFKELLPMRVKVAGFDRNGLALARQIALNNGHGEVDHSDWMLWTDAILKAVPEMEFRFRYLKRQNTWTAVYEAPEATLDFWLCRPTPEWRLTIKAPNSEPVNGRIRRLLQHPVARMKLDVAAHDVLSGVWEVCVPTRQRFSVDIAGTGELVPTWQASLGLRGQYEGKSRWSQIQVTVPPDARRALDRDLSGTYTLLAKCGQAMNSLHVKEPLEEGLPPIFLFFDPSRCGDAKDDRYVFSTSIDRLDYNTERNIFASLSPKWRESHKQKEQVQMDVEGGWVRCDAAHLTAVGGGDIAVNDSLALRDQATYSIPASAHDVSSATASCDHSAALLHVSVPLDAKSAEAMWHPDTWSQVDLPHHGNATFANLAWITERLPLLNAFDSWNTLRKVKIAGSACPTCAPLPPTIHWIKQPGKLNKNGGKTKSTIIAFEDRLEAGRYEHALKHRPSPFDVQLRLIDGVGSFRIGLNVNSLAHRALSRLPKSDSKGFVRLSWRLTPGQVFDVPRSPRVFTLPSNKQDPAHAQPRSFKLSLRKEQLRSLWWMLAQERAEGKAHTFVEEEISEALLPALGWRAEGKAERPVMVRGGVIADQVGYGKTIISLALAAETKGTAEPEPCPAGLIDMKATLIVVPGHLSKQWPSEIKRFTGDLFNLIVIQNVRDLQSKSIAELGKADLIVVASEIFESDAYWQRLEYLAVQPEDWLSDSQGGRFFADRLDTALVTLGEQTELLQAQGAPEARHHMSALRERAIADSESKKSEMLAANFGKRLKGAAYRDKYDAEQPTKKRPKLNSGGMWEADDGEYEELEIPMPKLSFRKAAGTESLDSAAVSKNYKLLSCPVLHMFRFRRVIADEFTYLERRASAAVLRLSSCYKWVLSGTPPVGDFPSIRSIATFMGIHLGVPDDAEGSTQHQKSRAKEQTAAEKFHSFRETHSAAWHTRRDDLAQEFLDTFVRQNIAEIDDIPTVEHIHTVKLPASEGAVYLELEHHLQALEMQARKETKFKNVTQGDRNARLEEALADSKTAEEALLKRCCHFTLDLTDKKRDAKSALEACEHIANARRTQLAGCEEDLRKTINVAVGLHAWIRRHGGFSKDETQPFRDWVRLSFNTTKHQGDAEAAGRLVKVLGKCGFPTASIPDAPVDGDIPKLGGKVDAAAVKWDLREQTHLLRRLSKELVGRVRSLRFFEVVRKLQHNSIEAKQLLEASECGHSPKPTSDIEMSVLSCCGHVSCHACMVEAVNNQRCVKGDACHAPVRSTNIVKVSSLGIEGELSSGRYGAKLQRLVDLIKTIPRQERVLVFLQWEDLASKVSEALQSGGISHVTLAGSVKQRANTLDRFQSSHSDSARVLLLKVNDASAAGSNLTTANHVIFLGPLFTTTLLNYRAVETQAIGRIRRFGQQRTVHIHRLLASDTIDMAIFESRSHELLAKTDHVHYPREDFVPLRRVKRPAEEIIEVETELDPI